MHAAPSVAAAAPQAEAAKAAAGKPKAKRHRDRAARRHRRPIDTEAKHALIVEAETGTVLLDKHADERMPPASMSKMMTAYIVFDI